MELSSVDKFDFRTASIEDLEPILVLILLCSEKFILPGVSDQGKRIYLESHSPEKMAERLETYEYLVATNSADEIIGVVGMKDRTHLFHLHVHPLYHQQGLGKKLWLLAKAHAEDAGAIKEFTVNSSKYAIDFYKKLGFEEQGEQVKNGFAYYPMILKN